MLRILPDVRIASNGRTGTARAVTSDGRSYLARATQLAEKLATALIDEDVSDATLTIAFLTGGVVNHHARDADEAHEMLDKIRQLKDRLLARTMGAGPPTLQ